MSRVDFGPTADDYQRHRAGFPEALFDRLVSRGVGLPGQRLLDLGAGTGTLARGFAQRGCIVTALDRSSEMLERARELAAAANLHVSTMVGAAEATGLPSASFDVVTAGQCWHWFDRGRAAVEVRRLLIAEGWLVIAHFDWLSLASGDFIDAMETLIAKHNPAQPAPHFSMGGGVGIYAPWLRDVAGAGFTSIETFSFDVGVPYTNEAWRGRVRSSQGVGAMLPPEAVEAFDREHAALLASFGAAEALTVPHRVFAVIARRGPDSSHGGAASGPHTPAA